MELWARLPVSRSQSEAKSTQDGLADLVLSSLLNTDPGSKSL